MIDKLTYKYILNFDAVYIHLPKNLPIYDIEYFLLYNCNFYWNNNNDIFQSTVFNKNDKSIYDFYFCLFVHDLNVCMYSIHDFNDNFSPASNKYDIIKANNIIRYLKLKQLNIFY